MKLLGDAPDVNVAKNITVTISSDRGLCGGINSNMAKATRGIKAVVPHLGEGENEHNLVVIGEKCRALLSRDMAESIQVAMVDVSKIPTTFSQTCAMTDVILSTEADAYRIVYNKFKS